MCFFQQVVPCPWCSEYISKSFRRPLKVMSRLGTTSIGALSQACPFHSQIHMSLIVNAKCIKRCNPVARLVFVKTLHSHHASPAVYVMITQLSSICLTSRQHLNQTTNQHELKFAPNRINSGADCN